MKALFRSFLLSFTFVALCDGWTDPTTIAYSSNVTQIDAAVNASKTVINLWTENSQSGSFLYGAAYSLGHLTTPYLLSENGMNGKVAIDENGNGIAVWLERDSTNCALMYCNFKPGVGWSEPKTITSEAQIFTLNIVMNSHGSACIIWCNQTTGGIEGVVLSSFNDELEPFEFKNNTGQNYNPQVNIDNNDNIYISWENNASLELFVSTYNGHDWADPRVLAKGVINSVLNISEEGEGVLAWTNMATYEIRASILTNGNWGLPQIISDIYSDCVSCTIYKGTAVVAWSDLNQGIVKARLFTNGTWNDSSIDLPLISNSDKPNTTIDQLGVAYVTVSNTDDYLKIIEIHSDESLKISKVFFNEGVVTQGEMKFCNLSSVFFWISSVNNMFGIKFSTN